MLSKWPTSVINRYDRKQEEVNTNNHFGCNNLCFYREPCSNFWDNHHVFGYGYHGALPTPNVLVNLIFIFISATHRTILVKEVVNKLLLESNEVFTTL